MKFWGVFFILTVSAAWVQAGFVGFVDAPKGCYAAKSYPCQVRVTGGFLTMERDSQMLQLADQSAVLFVSSDEIQLLSGVFWVRKAKDLKVKLSSVLSMTVQGEFFFRRQLDSTTLIRNLAGDVKFQSSRVFPNEALPVGFQNWYGLVDSTGQVSRGMIRPIEMTAFLKDWMPMSGFSMAKMKNRVQFYRDAWQESLDLSVQLYTQVVSRRIASLEERDRKRQEKLDAQNLEKVKLRNMFRERNGLGAIDHP